MGLSIIYFKGSQVDQSEYIVFIIADTDEIKYYAAITWFFTVFKGFPVYDGLISYYKTKLIKLCPWYHKSGPRLVGHMFNICVYRENKQITRPRAMILCV